MKAFLKKIKLVDHLTTEIDIQKNEFVSKFRSHVDEGSTDLFSDFFDIFTSSKNEYKGYVGPEGFKIKRRKRFFDMNMNLAVASGNYTQNGDQLIIKTEINGFSIMMIPYYLIATVIYLIFIAVFFIVDDIEVKAILIALPFICFHAALMFGIPYFMMRRSTKRMKHELEREFYYMTKN